MRPRRACGGVGVGLNHSDPFSCVFYDGQIVRTAWQGSDGNCYVTTHGFGNNVIPGANYVNETMAPVIFTAVDGGILK